MAEADRGDAREWERRKLLLKIRRVAECSYAGRCCGESDSDLPDSIAISLLRS